MVRLYVLIAAALLGAAVACSPLLEPTRSVQRPLLIQHHTAECMGPWHQLCLLVRAPGELAFTAHYGGIERFSYEPGYIYEIDVEEHQVANPPADGSSVRTVLRRLVSKQRVPPRMEFEMFLTSGEGRVVEMAPDQYRFYRQFQYVVRDISFGG